MELFRLDPNKNKNNAFSETSGGGLILSRVWSRFCALNDAARGATICSVFIPVFSYAF